MSDRNLQMKALRSEGLTLEAIGRKFGVTRERVRQIVGPAPDATECQICGTALQPGANSLTKYCGASCRSLAHNTRSTLRAARSCARCGCPCRGEVCKECRRKEWAHERKARYEKLERLWAEGLPMSEIAEAFDTTVNSLGGMMVHARAAGADLPRRRQPRKTANLTHAESRFQFGAALRNAVIRRPKRCEECGKEGHVEGHHVDYQKPLYVFWLCEDCHLKAHGKRSLEDVLAA